MLSSGLSDMTKLLHYTALDIPAIVVTIHTVFLSVPAQRTPRRSLKAVGGRSLEWSWVTICIKSLITDGVWTCAASASVLESTAGFCTWTCWWALTLRHVRRITRRCKSEVFGFIRKGPKWAQVFIPAKQKPCPSALKSQSRFDYTGGIRCGFCL